MKQLTDQELEQVAKELELDVSYVRELHQRALTAGTNLSLKDFSDFALAEKEGKKKLSPEMKKNMEAMMEAADEKKEEEEEETKEKAQARLKTVLAELSAEDRETLKGLLTEVEQAEQRPSDRMEVMLAQQTKAIEAQTIAMTKLVEALTTQRTKETAEFLSTLPREQAARFATDATKTEAPVPDDSAVLAKLKELEEKLGAATNPMSTLYDQFTSRHLNPGR